MSEPHDPPPVPQDGDDAAGGLPPDGGLAALGELLRRLGMPGAPGAGEGSASGLGFGGPGPGGAIPTGAAGAGDLGGLGGLDPEALLRELLGPDATLPPEVAQLMAALGGDPTSNPMAAVVQQQLGSLFGAADDPARLASSTDLARKVVSAHGDRAVGDAERREVEQAVAVARLWLDPVTAFDSPGGSGQAWSAAEWVHASMPRWHALVEPVADGVAAAGAAAMRKQVDELGGLEALGDAGAAVPGGAALGPLLGQVMGQLGPALQQVSAGMFGAQLAQGVGTLAGDLLSATEVGLPLVDEGVVALLPARVAAFAADLEIDLGQVRLYLAVREAARVRLFAEVPWLGPQVEAAVRDYGRQITIDTDAIEAALRSVDVSDFTDLAAMQQAFSQAQLFARQTTPAQQAALARLETTLALVEGWVDLVTDEAVATHLPQAGALGEAVRRRRSGGPAQRAFAALVGLELRPRRLRDARNLWAALADRGGIVLRDGSWAHPDLAPTSADLDDPLGYVERRVSPPAPDAIDAELQRLLSDEGPADRAPGTGD